MSNAETPADQTGGNTAASLADKLGELPPRIRVHALAKLLGQSSRDLLGKLAELGESPRSAQSSVTREVAFRVAETLAEPEDTATDQSVAAAGTAGRSVAETATTDQPAAGTAATGQSSSTTPEAGTPAAAAEPATIGGSGAVDSPSAACSDATEAGAAEETAAGARAAERTAAAEGPAAGTATTGTDAEPAGGAAAAEQTTAATVPGEGSAAAAAGEVSAARTAATEAPSGPERTDAADLAVESAAARTPAAGAAGDVSAEPPTEGAGDEAPAEPKAPLRRRVRRSAASPAETPAETPAVASPEPEPAPEREQPPARAKRPVHVPVFAAPSPVFLPPEPEPASDRPARTKPSGPVFGIGSEPVEPPVRGSRDDTAVERAEDEQVEDTSTEEIEDRSDDEGEGGGRRRRRRGRRGRGRGKGGDEGTDADDESGEDQPRKRDDKAEDKADANADPKAQEKTDDKPDAEPAEGESEAAEGDTESDSEGEGGNRRRRRRRRRKGGDDDSGEATGGDDPPNTVTHVRQAKAEQAERPARDEVRSVRGSTRLEAKRQRRRDGREAGRRRAPILSEAEFLARRESVERTMVVAEKGDNTQIGVLEDGVLVEHFVTAAGSGSIVGNVYLGRVQNVLPSMEAAFIDIGRGRNAVLYAGEVDWDAAGLEGKARKIEQALSTGDSVLVQVTKDPVGHKGARLTTQISLPGRFLVYVPAGGATGISRKLPENERRRLKDILKRIVPEDAGVIIRTASEGISEEELDRDVRRLKAQWDVIKDKADAGSSRKGGAPTMLYEEPDLLVKVVRDLFTEDFTKLEVQGSVAWDTIRSYVEHVAPDLTDRLKRYTGTGDVFADHRIDEQIMKALDRKVWLPSGGYLVIDRTEAMTVIDVNTGKFTGSGGNLEETVTRNNLESAEEIVRQLRLRDIGGIIVIDFIDMGLESNRELVLRRLTECLGRDRTRHQVAEVTSLGLVQMTRKKIGTGLLEAFSTPCEHCKGRGVIVSTEVQRGGSNGNGNGHNHGNGGDTKSSRRSRGRGGKNDEQHTEHVKADQPAGPTPEQRESAVSAVQAMVNASKAVSGKTEHGDNAGAAEVAAGVEPGQSGDRGEQTGQGKFGRSRREARAARQVSGGEAPAQPGETPAAEDADGQARHTPGDAGPAQPGEARAAAGVGEQSVAEQGVGDQGAGSGEAPVSEVPSNAEPSVAQPATAETPSEVLRATEAPEPTEPSAPAETTEPTQTAAQDESDVSAPVPASRPTRRRPRRAASRPAGPPVHASEQS
ncbi:MAG TPA: translation initiation factor IF-2 N-terminal domain-containing protein [Amycolatopsis sp.]|nr:translation initiation factor IF-2 N-terminal domain-containing protein [Amycolatopsis sp.]